MEQKEEDFTDGHIVYGITFVKLTRNIRQMEWTFIPVFINKII